MALVAVTEMIKGKMGIPWATIKKMIPEQKELPNQMEKKHFISKLSLFFTNPKTLGHWFQLSPLSPHGKGAQTKFLLASQHFLSYLVAGDVNNRAGRTESTFCDACCSIARDALNEATKQVKQKFGSPRKKLSYINHDMHKLLSEVHASKSALVNLLVSFFPTGGKFDSKIHAIRTQALAAIMCFLQDNEANGPLHYAVGQQIMALPDGQRVQLLNLLGFSTSKKVIKSLEKIIQDNSVPEDLIARSVN